MNRASFGASLVRLHICRVTLEPSSVYKKHKIYANWLYDFFISLHLFYFWWPNDHKPSETLQFMALPCNWRFNSWFDRQIHTAVEFDSDRCFFLLWPPNFRKFCMSKHSCSYVIIVPWNNIQKRLLLSIFSMQRRLWRVCTFAKLTWVFVLVLKYHVLAQITIYVPFIITVNTVVRLHLQPQEFCATISVLYQCVKKCSQCVVIKIPQ